MPPKLKQPPKPAEKEDPVVTIDEPEEEPAPKKERTRVSPVEEEVDEPPESGGEKPKRKIRFFWEKG